MYLGLGTLQTAEAKPCAAHTGQPHCGTCGAADAFASKWLQNLEHVATAGRPLSRSSSRGGGGGGGSDSPAVKPGGTVLSVAPLMGTEPDCDPTHAQWLHVHVRPPVRALLKVGIRV